MMNKNSFLLVFVFFLLAFAVNSGSVDLSDKPELELVSGDKLSFEYTDNNFGETILLCSDKKHYNNSMTSPEGKFVAKVGESQKGYVLYHSSSTKLDKLYKYGIGQREIVERTGQTCIKQSKETTDFGDPICDLWDVETIRKNVSYDYWQEVELVKNNIDELNISRKALIGDSKVAGLVELDEGNNYFKFVLDTGSYKKEPKDEFILEVVGLDKWSDVKQVLKINETIWKAYVKSYGHLDPFAGGGSWGRKHNITFNGSLIKEDMVDYPVLVTNVMLDNEVWNSSSAYHALSSGCDLRFSDDVDGNNELPLEVVSFDLDDADGSEIWVRVNLTNATDKTIWVWYDNGGASCYNRSDTYGSENVWNDDYIFVSHNAFNDSTSNGYDGAEEGGVSGGTSTNCKLGKCTYFDGNDDLMSLDAYSGVLDTIVDDANYSLSMWLNSTESTSPQMMMCFSKGWNSGADGLCVAVGNDGNGFSLMHDGSWHRDYESWDESSGWGYIVADINNKVILNGVSQVKGGGTGTAYMGDYNIGGGYHGKVGGYYDEVRIINATYSTQYFLTEYNNINNPSSFGRSGSGISTTNNNLPNVTLNSPADGSVDASTNQVLNVTVTDADNDTMNVSFYMANGTLLYNQSGVSNGSIVNWTWAGLTSLGFYEWYVNVTDGKNTKKGDVWNFTTAGCNPITNLVINNADWWYLNWSWTHNHNNCTNFSKYEVWIDHSYNTNTTNKTHIVSGLFPNTEKTISVRAKYHVNSYTAWINLTNTTTSGGSAWEEDETMISVMIALIGVAFLCLFFAFNLDSEHFLLKLLFSFFFFGILLLIPHVLINGENAANQKLLEIVWWMIRGFAIYVFIYLNYVLWLKNKLIDYNIITKPRPNPKWQKT